MSHFTVLVVGDNPEKQLEPFQENNMEDCPAEFLSFQDQTDEVEETWEEVVDVVLVNGEYVTKWNSMFYGVNKPDFPNGLDIERKTYEDIAKYHGQTKGEWAASYFGHEENEEGKFGYMANENSKWDWYQLGGRWSGMLKLKKFKHGDVGSPGIMTSEAKPGWCDSALKSDIDWEAMQVAAAVEANARYDEFEEAAGGLDITYRWSELDKTNIDAARDKYRDQPLMEALRKAKLHVWGNVEDIYFLGKGGREAYVKNAQCFSTFAILRDGEWYEQGEMGWFGMVLDELSTYDWEARFQSLIEDLPEDTRLSIYDCHV